MSQQYQYLFTFLIGSPFENEIYIWLLKDDKEHKDIEKWKEVWYSSEYHRLIHISINKAYTNKKRLFTLDEFNEMFMGDNKIREIPQIIIEKRQINKIHMSL